MKDITPKISIISPVYNAERYIVKCLDSILVQTFQDWELILVCLLYTSPSPRD